MDNPNAPDSASSVFPPLSSSSSAMMTNLHPPIMNSFNPNGSASNVNIGANSRSKNDDIILEWMITTVQILPILINRTLPGKEVSCVKLYTIRIYI